MARFYTDYLWFENLHLSSVFTGILGAKVALGVIFTFAFFVMCFVSLTVADRLAPTFRPTGPEDELLTRYHDFVEPRAWLVRGGVSLLFGLIAGVGQSNLWQQWILFTHAQDLRHQGRHVPHRRRLLRVPPAVPGERRPNGCSTR